MTTADRRRFIKSTAALAALAAVRSPVRAFSSQARRAISVASLPADLAVLEQFRVAADLGFAGVEMRTAASRQEAQRVRDAASHTGLRISSVVVTGRDVADVLTSLHNARLWGADAVSIRPGIRDGRVSYRDAWNTSQNMIRQQLLPMARDLGVVLAIEKIWDGFLVGPSELARYVDAFDSPLIRAVVDTSRMPFYTRPQDWIRVLGPRIVNARVQDVADLGPLGEIGYGGWVTLECQSATLPRFKTV